MGISPRAIRTQVTSSSIVTAPSLWQSPAQAWALAGAHGKNHRPSPRSSVGMMRYARNLLLAVATTAVRSPFREPPPTVNVMIFPLARSGSLTPSGKQIRELAICLRRQRREYWLELARLLFSAIARPHRKDHHAVGWPTGFLTKRTTALPMTSALSHGNPLDTRSLTSHGRCHPAIEQSRLWERGASGRELLRAACASLGKSTPYVLNVYDARHRAPPRGRANWRSPEPLEKSRLRRDRWSIQLEARRPPREPQLACAAVLRFRRLTKSECLDKLAARGTLEPGRAHTICCDRTFVG
jgi:hypothetical protein